MASCLRIARIATSSLIVVAAVLLSGCDNSDVVTGTITLDNKPLSEAMVQFTPEDSDGRIALGRTNSNGWYRLKSSRNISTVSPGKYRIRITTSDLVASDDQGEAMSPEKVPAKFNTNSELVEEVEQGPNELNFELTTE